MANDRNHNHLTHQVNLALTTLRAAREMLANDARNPVVSLLIQAEYELLAPIEFTDEDGNYARLKVSPRDLPKLVASLQLRLPARKEPS